MTRTKKISSRIFSLNKLNLNKSFLIVFYIIFLIIWTLRNWGLFVFGNSQEIHWVIFNQLVKLGIWIIPIYIIINYFQKKNFLEYVGLKKWGVNSIKLSVLASFLLGIFNFTAVIANQNFSLNNLNYLLPLSTLVGTVIAAPFIEEIFFRGFILNIASENWGFWKGNIITSVFFVIIHWPNWLFFNNFSWFSSIYLFIFSILCGLIVRHGKGTIWGAMLFHFINNYIASL
jgi:membrane protease YdiL (CAAX protease family)